MRKQNSNPLYHVVKEDIKKQIDNQELSPGDFILTEGELCEHYKVSRVTVRRAIEELVSEGVLQREHGKTASVTDNLIPRSLNHLGGLHEELTQTGIKCSSYILNSEVIAADERLAQKMKVEPNASILKFERLRYADGAPLCHQTAYVNKNLCPDLDVKELTNTSLYETFEKKFNLEIDYATQTISAVLSSYKVAALLELPERTCMLCVRRLTYLKGEKCIEYSESYYVGGRYNLSMTLQR
jgi:DNA-binding GntR family transcriptional regulator